MKRITSIALIILMSFQCLYKLGVITYFQLNREYIAEVLCVNKEKPITMCHGQCFLDKNLDLAEDQTSDEGTVPPGNQKVDFPVFIVSENTYSLQQGFSYQLHNAAYLFCISSKHALAPFHPPAIVS